MLTCKYCGSSRLKTVGGDFGDPFDRKGEKTICLDCGRTIYIKPNLDDIADFSHESTKQDVVHNPNKHQKT